MTRGVGLFGRKAEAGRADRHQLYQESVQDTEAEIDFVEETWRALRDRPAELLREDFCGTAATACEWVRRDPLHVAIGVDLDGSVLDWGEANNVAALSEEQAGRIELRQQDVLEPADELADIALAMNFSYYLFLQRHELLAYFRNVLDGLMDDGLFLLGFSRDAEPASRLRITTRRTSVTPWRSPRPRPRGCPRSRPPAARASSLPWRPASTGPGHPPRGP